MGRHTSKEKWIKLFKEYESGNWNWDEYYKNNIVFATWESKAIYRPGNLTNKKRSARSRFIIKYKQWKKLDNRFMENKKVSKTKKKSIDEIVSNMTDQEKDEFIKMQLERLHKLPKKERKAIANTTNWKISRKAEIFGLSRSSFYKKPMQGERTYKWDWIKPLLLTIVEENKGIYGSGKISVILSQKGININDREIRRCMNRWDIKCKTRQKRKVRESKNTNVHFKDLVKRNYNPKEDNILSTDVSYIPTKTNKGFSYLSIAISHKTKLIESSKLSEFNDNDLVIKTIKQLNRNKPTIFHSDHGSQYSSEYVINIAKEHNLITSMGRVGNSLDNREAEYFFSCLKSEWLNHIDTSKMTLDEVNELINEYIDWYNEKRIQKRLQWQTPNQVSKYAI